MTDSAEDGRQTPQSQPSKLDVAREMVLALEPLVRLVIVFALIVGVPYAVGGVILHFYPPPPDSGIASGWWLDYSRWAVGAGIIFGVGFSVFVITEWYRTAKDRARKKVDDHAE